LPYAQAKAEALLAIEQEPSLPLGHLIYALMQVELNEDLERAREHCYKGLELSQGDDDYIAKYSMVLGRIFAAWGKIDEAEAEYQRALSLEPDGNLTHTHYGLFLLEQRHDLRAAFEHFKIALMRDPESERTREKIAESLKNIDPSEAIDDPLFNFLRENA
jgi:Tfp pilus assembly protein PilF